MGGLCQLVVPGRVKFDGKLPNFLVSNLTMNVFGRDGDRLPFLYERSTDSAMILHMSLLTPMIWRMGI